MLETKTINKPLTMEPPLPMLPPHLVDSNGIKFDPREPRSELLSEFRSKPPRLSVEVVSHAIQLCSLITENTALDSVSFNLTILDVKDSH